MRRIKAIMIFELKRIFQKPQSFLLMFGMPLLFTFIFGALFSSDSEPKPNIVVVDEDHSTLSKALINELESKNIMELSLENAKDARSKFDDQKITGYIRIDKGFEEQILNKDIPVIIFVYSPSFNGAKMIEQVINDSMVKHRIVASASSVYQEITGDNWKGVQEKITNELATSDGIKNIPITKNKELETMNNMTARSAGFTIMFVMISLLISTGVFLEARQTGVWYRIMSTPTSKKEILIGYLLAFFLIGWIQFGVLMLVSTFVFNVNWGNMLGIFVLVSCLLLCTIGLGLFIAGFVKTSEQQSVFGNLIIVSTCMLGGVYWPLEIMPNMMQQIAKFVPQYWGLEGFAELAVRGGTVADVLAPSGVLLVFTIVFLFVGMTRIRFE
ncbi:ABC transporter permease [Lederbergia wuyishanensis]|uniref:ABC-2 type transport system permease protein n=1 Tax=Lederbergia wuyishanensis TaxID=1347903 RepID=A0ABU0DAM2_9BACI|nr:ABC transporter permease [Lederbergia wuyishanensis]MCJ8009662.1 ABC transporter permease [Lederbergia wuyishanensis]MDQ0345464.1 ABC-2 type transport system permease protein [Lederbergia wuyishanensis]